MSKKEIKKPANQCSSCRNWNNKQAELEYSQFYGICTCHKWKFITTDNSDVRVLDRDNVSGKHMGVHTFENRSRVVPIGKVEPSRYCLVTSEHFGCCNHEAAISENERL